MNCGVLVHSYKYHNIHIAKYVNHSMKNIFTIIAHSNYLNFKVFSVVNIISVPGYVIFNFCSNQGG